MVRGLFFSAALATAANAMTIDKRSYNGPGTVLPVGTNFPDPSLIQHGNTWYAYSTNSGGKNVQVAESSDFVHWNLLNNVDALPKTGSWSTGGDVWAPSVIQRADGTFVMYYCADSPQHLPNKANHCIGSATSLSPTGPFMPENDSIVCAENQGGAIDPSGFIDKDGSIWMVYKIDGNNIGHGGSCGNTVAPIQSTPIMLQRMNAAGTATDGSAPQIILDRGDADGPYVEAPSLVRVENTYFLFFSSGCYADGDYDTSYAVSHNGINANGRNYTKAGYPVAPLLQTNNPAPLYSPGGLTIAPDGKHVVFMADYQKSFQTRELYAGLVTIDPNAGTVSI